MPRKIRCTVEAIIAHGERVYTLDLHPEMPVPAFQPGQFLHLTVDDYDPASFWPESRVFSIASSPHDRSLLRICYSVKGRYTEKMERTLRTGLEVWVKLPYGEFIIDRTQDTVLIAGGTGISAFTAFIEAMQPSDSLQVCLVYGARTPDLWLFRSMIEQQVKACPSFTTLFFAESGLTSCLHGTSESPMRAEAADARLHFLSGRISLDRLFPSSVLCPLSSVLFYLSGPPPMLASLRADLQSRGIPSDRVRVDAWD